MNEEQIKQNIEERWSPYDHHKSHGRFWTGFFLLLVGVLLLLKTTGAVFFPFWFFSWPMILMAFGLLSGVRHGFKGGFWMVMLVIGLLFLFNEIHHDWDLDRYIGPIAIIAVGLLFITRPKRKHWRNWNREQRFRSDWKTVNPDPSAANQPDTIQGSFDSRDFIDVTAVFGGVKKNILSKQFKGGDIVSFMGGSEIDLSQADINGHVRIDITNVFGGTKLVVPSTWDVHNDITAIFGGVDDKRLLAGVTLDANKVLILDGTCMFGGVEIRSF